MSQPAGSSARSAAPAPSSRSQPPSTPRDARLIALILASMGVESASEGVVRMLMEFAHRYTSDILSDALVFAEHAGKQHAAQGPDLEDLRLAVQAKTEHSMAGPMSKEFLLTLADQVNKVALPALPEAYGVRLPPEKDRLTAATFDIVPLPSEDDSDAVGNDKLEGLEGEDEEGGSDDESESGSEGMMMEVVAGMNGSNGAGAETGKRRLEDMEDDDYD